MTSAKPMHMEVDVSVPGPGPADDGVLGDDERTDKEAAPPAALTAMERSPPSDAPGNRPGQRGRAPSISSDVNGRKKKHRRGKQKGGRRHRHWKPYTKMTWEEKKELEERETRRACKKREERFASGQPMAPYNTTQFLMEQHQHSDLKLEEHSRPRLNKSDAAQDGGGSGGASGSADGSSEEYYSSPDDEEIFLEKEFTEAYENFHAERLQTMSKDELVREYLELESKVDLMEKRRKEESKSTNGRLSSSGTSLASDKADVQDPLSPKGLKLTVSPKKPTQVAAEETTVFIMQQEINRLRQDNERLRRENEQLHRTQLSNSVTEGEP